MKITKYGHACLLVEYNNSKLLIDPGSFSFDEKNQPEQIGRVEAILITHSHSDHVVPNIIKAFIAMGAPEIITNQVVGAMLEKEGIAFSVLAAGEQKQIAGFSIEAFHAPHGPMPNPANQNTAFYINSMLLHPGDSYATEGLPHSPHILAVPSQGPWSRLVDAIAYATEMKPHNVIPIHNALYNQDMTGYLDSSIGEQLTKQGINYHQLAVGESWDAN